MQQLERGVSYRKEGGREGGEGREGREGERREGGRKKEGGREGGRKKMDQLLTVFSTPSCVSF